MNWSCVGKSYLWLEFPRPHRGEDSSRGHSCSRYRGMDGQGGSRGCGKTSMTSKKHEGGMAGCGVGIVGYRLPGVCLSRWGLDDILKQGEGWDMIRFTSLLVSLGLQILLILVKTHWEKGGQEMITSPAHSGLMEKQNVRQHIAMALGNWNWGLTKIILNSRWCHFAFHNSVFQSQYCPLGILSYFKFTGLEGKMFKEYFHIVFHT